jgi:hypothetical protein
MNYIKLNSIKMGCSPSNEFDYYSKYSEENNYMLVIIKPSFYPEKRIKYPNKIEFIKIYQCINENIPKDCVIGKYYKDCLITIKMENKLYYYTLSTTCNIIFNYNFHEKTS